LPLRVSAKSPALVRAAWPARRAFFREIFMPSFDFTSEADMVALKNAVDITARQIDNRYDFKGTSAKLELNEKDKVITLHGDSDFQLDQIKDILFPAMEKKETESTKRLDHQTVQKVSGNKVKQELKIKNGIETEMAKKIVKMIKDAKLKVQASIQGEEVRVQGTKRDDLQDCIALIKKSITDFPIKYGNFRD
jgi:cyclic-di-GMP-binding protein